MRDVENVVHHVVLGFNVLREVHQPRPTATEIGPVVVADEARVVQLVVAVLLFFAQLRERVDHDAENCAI